MKYTKQDIVDIVKETVKEVTGIEIYHPDVSLLDSKLAINPVDFLYVFDILEKKLKIPVTDILKNSRYDVMVLDNFTDQILAMLHTN